MTRLPVELTFNVEGIMKEFIEGILERLRAEFDPEVMGQGFAGLVSNIVVCLLTFLAFYLLWRVTRPVIGALLKRTSADETLRTFLETAYKYAVLILGLVQALGAIGINTSAVFASLGLAGLTLGFAARGRSLKYHFRNNHLLGSAICNW